MRGLKLGFLSAVLWLTATTAQAQSNMENVEIKATQLSERVYMLTGMGGNIGVYVGDDGVVMIDAQYKGLAEKISAAIAEISNQPIRTLVNTHFHGDHTDGNAAFAKQGVKVVAHENVKTRLAANEKFDQAGLPTITFDNALEVKTGGTAVSLKHYPNGHTDGDVVVWFPSSNVIHAGDLFFVDRFPFIDLNSGGNVQGYIDNVRAVIAEIDGDTQIIPGHGALSKRSDWLRLVQMIEATREEVMTMKEQGLSEDHAVAKGLSEQWADWSWSFINEERWIRTLYKSV
ncbi:Glyoxylase, beta-lactamase superfamily II [Pseudidiomarina maritima]|jgi:glyoxylase-like metal-dependent hydrolase (beta-lactamase superfamily II)|uniref:Glyoxylase, beta-lactamase superfamily II n=1 Tax=Pseudidiomarina maritima TaxID=519453 RepID=A0A1I6GNF8_9GAMM|nr:MBL fold metallo-hydrolase [Pseudidiomarina maritima]SFR43734.1 Glyoxylase, beta-lactamase superfamily II [Pseudidiomarina maritima]